MAEFKHKYKTLLILLKALIYLKRAIFGLGKMLGIGLGYLNIILRNTLGVRFYRLKLQLKKNLNLSQLSWGGKIFEIFGRRDSLQIVLFALIFIIMIPHTKLYVKNTIKIPGQDTLLYKIIGPGEEDFNLEEVSMDYNALNFKFTESPWRQGTISAQAGTNGNYNYLSNIASGQEIVIGSEGSALSKPHIIPGATTPTVASPIGRSEIIIHEVEPGETIGFIAQKYQIDINTILLANNLTLRSYIRPGDKLKILPTSGLTYKIKKGDTVAKIAKTYKSTEEKIIKFNHLKEGGSDIVIGEEIIIPDGVKPQTAVVTKPTANTQPSGNYAPSASAPTTAGTNFLWPAGVRRITQYYGWRHTGVDIAGPIGTPLYAAKDGTVSRSQCGWNGGYGCYIIIDHGNGTQTLYGHASRLFVGVGEKVIQGQNIAAMGSTGRSTGSHLHFEVRVNGRRLNPLQYIR